MKNKKAFLWIGISLIGIAVIILIIYFVRNSKKTCPDGSKVKRSQDCPKDEGEVKKEETSGSTPSPVVNEGFPLSVGMRGNNVTQLQNGLIKMGKSIPAGATSYFGSQTLSALQSAGYDAPVSKPDFDAIMAGKIKGTGGIAGSPKPTQTTGCVGFYSIPVYVKSESASMYYSKTSPSPTKVVSGRGKLVGTAKTTDKCWVKVALPNQPNFYLYVHSSELMV